MADEKILIVEGNPTRARGLCLIFRDLGGYDVVHAPTLEAAIHEVKSGPLDLILSNITVTRPLDGVKLVQLILVRQASKHRTPVMIVTPEKDRGAVKECVRAGVVDYTVSYDPVVLLQRVRRALAQRRDLGESEARAGVFHALEQILVLPTISAVHTQLDQLLQSETTSAEDVARVAALDQSITANVLRLANSALFGFQRQILSVKDAVALLGFKAVQVAVAAVSTFEALGRMEERNFDRTAFWEHAVGCGTIARVIATRLDADQDHAFGAGILHDIGKVALDSHFHDYFAAALKAAAEGRTPILEAEQKLLPVTHEDVGRYLAQRWNLPEPLVEAIGSHHSLTVQNPEHAQLVDLVHVADAQCRQLGIGSAGDDLAWEPGEAALKRLGVTAEALAEWADEMREEVKMSEGLLDFA